MALTAADRVKETSTTIGTGTFTLAGAMTAFRTFADIGDTNTCHYMIEAVDADGNPTGDWEVGFGTYTLSGTTLARGTVFSNSLGTTALISFAAGMKHVSNVHDALNGRLVGCKLRLAGNVPITENMETTVNFDAVDHELWDTNGFHEGVTNPSRITIPTGFDGTYLIEAHARWATTAASQGRRLYMKRFNSGSTQVDSELDAINSIASLNSVQSVSAIHQAVGGEYIEFSLLHWGVGAVDLLGGASTGAFTSLSAIRLGN